VQCVCCGRLEDTGIKLGDFARGQSEYRRKPIDFGVGERLGKRGFVHFGEQDVLHRDKSPVVPVTWRWLGLRACGCGTFRLGVSRHKANRWSKAATWDDVKVGATVANFVARRPARVAHVALVVGRNPWTAHM